ncbi:MAG TPA: nucleotidyltransferase domain-containing protein, partial [Saprospiraceae bacterium]|nr:nucleotidyltransferase domain-containing protein [Saprospiraceae bacterium]
LNIVKSRLKKENRGTQIEISREAIIESIKTYFSTKPVEKVWVFGSFAKNNLTSKDSDLDIMIAFKKPNKISLFDLVQMEEELSGKIGREIDLVEEGQELKSIKDSIKKERLIVYGG